MKDYASYFYKKMPDVHFGVDIFLKTDLQRGMTLKMHWHEHMQLYYFISGNAMLECDKKCFNVGSGDIAVINSNELHYLESLSDDLEFYVIRIDLPFLFSNKVDLCQTKYLAPLSQNLITFSNLIEDDDQILDCIVKMFHEYSDRKIGFELQVKSSIYQLIVFLLRGHISKIMTSEELASKVNSLKRFDSILNYLAEHYTEKISVSELAEKGNITVFYFCRIFKQLTGKTMTEYVNQLRLEKSTEYLKKGELNITEIALKCGFEGVNYYSRLFRRYYHVSPTKFRE
jgi:AraC-like DNA-binding protein